MLAEFLNPAKTTRQVRRPDATALRELNGFAMTLPGLETLAYIGSRLLAREGYTKRQDAGRNLHVKTYAFLAGRRNPGNKIARAIEKPGQLGCPG